MEAKASHKLPPSSLFKASQVTIRLGNEAYSAHQEILCFHSAYFRRAFRGGFAESLRKEFTLDDDPYIFELALYWMYFGRLEIEESYKFISMANEDHAYGTQTRSSEERRFEIGLRLWVLSDKRIIPALQNDAIIYLHKVGQMPALREVGRALAVAIAEVWESTTEKSKLRKFLIQGITTAIDPESPSTSNTFHKGLLVQAFREGASLALM